MASKGKWLIALLSVLFLQNMKAQNTERQTVRDTVQTKVCVAFGMEDSRVRPDYAANRSQLSRLDTLIHWFLTDSLVTLRSIDIHGYGSPDGPVRYNERLARRRTDSVKTFVSNIFANQQGQWPAQKVSTTFTAEDWQGLETYVEQASLTELPHREQLLQLMRSSRHPDMKERLLRRFYPQDYRYLVRQVMPTLRRTDVTFDYFTTRYIVPMVPLVVTTPAVVDTIVADEVVADSTYIVEDEQITVKESSPLGFLMGLKTNLLYDAALIPNLGVEFFLNRHLSVTADGFWTWISSDSRHRYWQGYGGYLGMRYYFSGVRKNQAQSSGHYAPYLRGHHLGIYGLGMTYDVEWGGRGYQAARFGFGGGIEYGYALPIARRLNLDFSIGVGFQDGEYKEYLPMDGHYVWQSTHKRHWWGPTKAEVSLVWLIGKGGAR